MRILLLLLASSFTFADGHSSEEKAVLAAVQKLYDARNARDFETAASLNSSSGVYSTNSDGSFHKPVENITPEGLERASAVGFNLVHYPEAIKLSKDVYFVRFYYEGVAGKESKPYRTRVTTTWVNENGGWKLKTQHYSSAQYGGTHETILEDFDN